MTKPQPWVKFEEIEEKRGRFIVSPLRRGMGITIGNAMRRVLLSSLSGYAITTCKIDGVQHEFSAIPCVKEDVFDVIANLKQVVFQSTTEDVEKASISIEGPARVTANDIEVSSNMTIINPDQFICEITEKGSFNLEITLTHGFGYQAAEAQENLEDTSVISIDASFSPIVRVNHSVEDIRVGKELDYDELSLEVWTNGATTPEETVKLASAILRDQFELFERLNEAPEVDEDDELNGESDSEADVALQMSVDDLELSARSSNCLKRAGIATVEELISKELIELKQIKNFGAKSADEINEKLKQYGLALNEG